MSTDNMESRHFEDWMSAKSYEKYRGTFIENLQPKILANLKNVRQMNELTNNQRDIGAKLLTQFFFGVHMAYKRMGDKYDHYNYLLETADSEECPAIGLSTADNTYVFNLHWFTNEILAISSGKKIYSDVMGVDGSIKVDDFFELAGVEEAAHYMFYNEKGNIGRLANQNAPIEVRYSTSEMESRAIIWKKAHSEHYMPQYAQLFGRLQEKI